MTYTKAPLPFTGQKRNFLKHLKQVLDKIPDNGEGWTIVDAFGGSGLLAHTAKQYKPAARVVYNDFDGYTDRLHHIPDTNRLRGRLAEVLKDIPKGSRLTPEIKAEVIGIIQNFNGFKDLRTIVAWLLFSGNFAESFEAFYKKTMYNTLPQSGYPAADDYLIGVEIESRDFRQLLPQFAGRPKTLLLLDPPYVSTEQRSYAKPHYFGMVQFLHLMDMVQPPFVLSGSTRSELADYLAYLKKHRPEEWRRFDGCETVTVSASVNNAVKYEDNMIYKI